MGSQPLIVAKLGDKLKRIQKGNALVYRIPLQYPPLGSLANETGAIVTVRDRVTKFLYPAETVKPGPKQDTVLIGDLKSAGIRAERMTVRLGIKMAVRGGIVQLGDRRADCRACLRKGKTR